MTIWECLHLETLWLLFWKILATPLNKIANAKPEWKTSYFSSNALLQTKTVRKPHSLGHTYLCSTYKGAPLGSDMDPLWFKKKMDFVNLFEQRSPIISTTCRRGAPFWSKENRSEEHYAETCTSVGCTENASLPAVSFVILDRNSNFLLASFLFSPVVHKVHEPTSFNIDEKSHTQKTKTPKNKKRKHFECVKQKTKKMS